MLALIAATARMIPTAQNPSGKKTAGLEVRQSYGVEAVEPDWMFLDVRFDWKLREQPLNVRAQFFDEAKQPTGGPNWTMQIQTQFVFLRK